MRLPNFDLVGEADEVKVIAGSQILQDGEQSVFSLKEEKSEWRKMISYNKQILCCGYTICITTLELQWLELKQELYQSNAQAFDQLWCFSPKKASEPNQAQEGGVSIL